MMRWAGSRGPVAVVATLAAVIVLALAHPALAQCAMCRSALESPEAAGLAWAFRRGILLLLAAPFITVAVIAVLVARATRGSRSDPGL